MALHFTCTRVLTRDETRRRLSKTGKTHPPPAAVAGMPVIGSRSLGLPSHSTLPLRRQSGRLHWGVDHRGGRPTPQCDRRVPRA